MSLHRYDRDFLLQFMAYYKAKPETLPAPDAIGMEQFRLSYLVPSMGSGWPATSVPHPISGIKAELESVSNKAISEERLAVPQNNLTTLSATDGTDGFLLGGRPHSMLRSGFMNAYTQIVGGKRVRSKRRQKYASQSSEALTTAHLELPSSTGSEGTAGFRRPLYSDLAPGSKVKDESYGDPRVTGH